MKKALDFSKAFNNYISFINQAGRSFGTFQHPCRS